MAIYNDSGNFEYSSREVKVVANNLDAAGLDVVYSKSGLSEAEYLEVKLRGEEGDYEGNEWIEPYKIRFAEHETSPRYYHRERGYADVYQVAKKKKHMEVQGDHWDALEAAAKYFNVALPKRARTIIAKKRADEEKQRQSQAQIERERTSRQEREEAIYWQIQTLISQYATEDEMKYLSYTGQKKKSKKKQVRKAQENIARKIAEGTGLSYADVFALI
ncbi:MAG: hypothetical protein Q8O94_02865 [bacterium]|nr:hypothetical protein [bacterium]